MALICYRDGFVLVGSVAGQRYWSSMLNLEGCMITCGLWTPDDEKVGKCSNNTNLGFSLCGRYIVPFMTPSDHYLQVMFGTSDGRVIVMSSTGAMVAQVTLMEGQEISCIEWNCEKFYLNERNSSAPDDTQPSTTCENSQPRSEFVGNNSWWELCISMHGTYLMVGDQSLVPVNPKSRRDVKKHRANHLHYNWRLWVLVFCWMLFSWNIYLISFLLPYAALIPCQIQWLLCHYGWQYHCIDWHWDFILNHQGSALSLLVLIYACTAGFSC